MLLESNNVGRVDVANFASVNNADSNVLSDADDLADFFAVDGLHCDVVIEFL
jgi:hypothetical protein